MNNKKNYALKRIEKSRKTIESLVEELQNKIDNKEQFSVEYLEKVKKILLGEANLAKDLATKDPSLLLNPQFNLVMQYSMKGYDLAIKIQAKQLKTFSDGVDSNMKKLASNFEYEITDQEIDDLIDRRS